MAISYNKTKVLLPSKLTISLIISSFLYFRCFPRLVIASEIGLCSKSDDIIERGGQSGGLYGETVLHQEIGGSPDAVLLNKHELQLKKLQVLVRELGQLVARLESQLDVSQIEIRKSFASSLDNAIRDLSDKFVEEGRFSRKGEASSLMKKYNALWTERFHFTSAVKLVTYPACVNLLPRDSEGFNKYFAVGDEKGKVLIFLRSGDLSLEFNTFLDSADGSRITAMVSYSSIYKNETMIVTGHEDGNIVVHRIWESSSSEESSSLQVARGVAFEVPQSNKPRISILEVHNVGRKKYILATNGGGKIMIFWEDGKFHGVATPTAYPVAFFKQRLLFLTTSGAGSLDLRTMKIKESKCEGLNNSVVESYVFDAMDRSRAYGLTSEGDLIKIVLLGDAINFKCQIRSKWKLDLSHPMALQTIKGYLLITDNKKVLVYNTSSQQYVRGSRVRFMFSASIDEIASSFLNQQHPSYTETITSPLIASDSDKDILIHLGNGYIALYRSKLPIIKSEFNSILWTSPVLFFILFLFGAWHFFASKKEVLTSWGPDDPAIPPSTVTGADSPENTEMMNLRGTTSLIGSSSQYVSPPRYAGGEANSFLPGGLDTAPVDPRFTELKFRGSTVEAGKRRDSLFGNSQGVSVGS